MHTYSMFNTFIPTHPPSLLSSLHHAFALPPSQVPVGCRSVWPSISFVTLICSKYVSLRTCATAHVKFRVHVHVVYMCVNDYVQASFFLLLQSLPALTHLEEYLLARYSADWLHSSQPFRYTHTLTHTHTHAPVIYWKWNYLLSSGLSSSLRSGVQANESITYR